MKLSLGSKKTKILGIDIGSNLIKVVLSINQSGKPSTIDFCGILETGSSDAHYEKELREYLIKNRLTGNIATACLDDESFKIRKIDLPKMPEADLKEAVKWKMRDIVDGSIEDFVVRYSHLPQLTEGKKNVYVGYAVRKSAVSHMITLMQRVGVTCEFVEPAAVSLSSILERQELGSDEWVGGIDLGAHHSLLVIVGHQKFYFSRPLMGINLAAAKADGNAFQQKLAAEIQNSLDTFAVTFHVEHINRLFLAGGGAQIEGLSDYLSQNLGIITQKVNGFLGLQVNPMMRSAYQAQSSLLAQALAVSGINV